MSPDFKSMSTETFTPASSEGSVSSIFYKSAVSLPINQPWSDADLQVVFDAHKQNQKKLNFSS